MSAEDAIQKLVDEGLIKPRPDSAPRLSKNLPTMKQGMADLQLALASMQVIVDINRPACRLVQILRELDEDTKKLPLVLEAAQQILAIAQALSTVSAKPRGAH